MWELREESVLMGNSKEELMVDKVELLEENERLRGELVRYRKSISKILGYVEELEREVRIPVGGRLCRCEVCEPLNDALDGINGYRSEFCNKVEDGLEGNRGLLGERLLSVLRLVFGLVLVLGIIYYFYG